MESTIQAIPAKAKGDFVTWLIYSALGNHALSETAAFYLIDLHANQLADDSFGRSQICNRILSDMDSVALQYGIIDPAAAAEAWGNIGSVCPPEYRALEQVHAAAAKEEVIYHLLRLGANRHANLFNEDPTEYDRRVNEGRLWWESHQAADVKRNQPIIGDVPAASSQVLSGQEVREGIERMFAAEGKTIPATRK